MPTLLETRLDANRPRFRESPTGWCIHDIQRPLDTFSSDSCDRLRVCRVANEHLRCHRFCPAWKTNAINKTSAQLTEHRKSIQTASDPEIRSWRTQHERGSAAHSIPADRRRGTSRVALRPFVIHSSRIDVRIRLLFRTSVPESFHVERNGLIASGMTASIDTRSAGLRLAPG